jgi:hypothetical protein
LNLSDREWLIRELKHERGILKAQFAYPDLHHLRITYDSSAFGDSTLLDAVTRHGLSAEFPTSEGPRVERVLIAIDPEGESTSTIDYVGRIAAGHENLHFCLYCRLPALPPALREHGGSEDPARERELGLELSAKVEQWVSEKRDELRPVLQGARSRLLSAGVPETAIEIESSWDASPGESLAEALIRVAHASGCYTIAVSRQHGSALSELMHHHTGDELAKVGSDLVLWIVEY